MRTKCPFSQHIKLYFFGMKRISSLLRHIRPSRLYVTSISHVHPSHMSITSVCHVCPSSLSIALAPEVRTIVCTPILCAKGNPITKSTCPTAEQLSQAGRIEMQVLLHMIEIYASICLYKLNIINSFCSPGMILCFTYLAG